MYQGSQIHHSSNVHQTAIIGPNVTIGKNNYIGPFCIIGMPAEHKESWPAQNACSYSGFDDEKLGSVVIGDNNIITGHVTIDAGTFRPTWIYDNCFLMKGVHIGHDAVVAHDVTMAPHAVIGGKAIIMKGANIGMSACIHQYGIVGYYAMLGMGSIVTKKSKIEPFQTYAGNPVRHLGENKKTIHLFTQELLDIYNQQYESSRNLA